MTTASTPIIPDYAQPTAAGGFVTQTLALFVDAYRELNAKKLFWIVLILSVVVVAGFATMAIAYRHADVVLEETATRATASGNDRAGPMAPALQARNHAATPAP